MPVGKSGNPARRAQQDAPIVQQTAKAMRAAVELVRGMEAAGVHPETIMLAKAAAAGLLAAYAAQTGLPAPWDVMAP